jgi:hypothetical protein
MPRHAAPACLGAIVRVARRPDHSIDPTSTALSIRRDRAEVHQSGVEHPPTLPR